MNYCFAWKINILEWFKITSRRLNWKDNLPRYLLPMLFISIWLHWFGTSVSACIKHIFFIVNSWSEAKVWGLYTLIPWVWPCLLLSWQQYWDASFLMIEATQSRFTFLSQIISKRWLSCMLWTSTLSDGWICLNNFDSFVELVRLCSLRSNECTWLCLWFVCPLSYFCGDGIQRVNELLCYSSTLSFIA